MNTIPNEETQAGHGKARVDILVVIALVTHTPEAIPGEENFCQWIISTFQTICRFIGELYFSSF